MTDSSGPSQFPQKPRLPGADIPPRAEDGQRARVERLPPALHLLKSPARIEGTVLEVRPDGAVSVATDDGEIALRVIAVDEKSRIRAGERIQIDLPSGNPPREATIRLSPQEARGRGADGPPRESRNETDAPVRPAQTPVSVEIGGAAQRPEPARPTPPPPASPPQAARLETGDTVRLLPLTPAQAQAALAPAATPPAPASPSEQSFIPSVYILKNPVDFIGILSDDGDTSSTPAGPLSTGLTPEPAPPASLLQSPPPVLPPATSALPDLILQNAAPTAPAPAGPVSSAILTPATPAAGVPSPQPSLPVKLRTLLGALLPASSRLPSEASSLLPPAVSAAPDLSDAQTGTGATVRLPGLPPTAANPGETPLTAALTAALPPALPPAAPPGGPATAFAPLFPASGHRPSPLDVRVASIAPPSAALSLPEGGKTASPAPAAPRGPGLLLANLPAAAGLATVLGFLETGAGQALPVIDLFLPGVPFPQAFALQFAAENLPAGAQIGLIPQMGPLSFTDAPWPLFPPANLLQTGPWSTLEDAVQILAQTAPQAAQGLAQSLPSPSNPALFGPAALFFLAAVRSGDFSGWLGERALEALSRAGRGGMAGRLLGESAGGGRSSSPQAGGDWRGFALPLFWQGEIHKMAVHYRQDEGQKESPERKGGQTRFVFDLDLSRMGGVQLDGLLRGQRLDLVVRSLQPFSQSMQADMRRLYNGALGEAGMDGELSFQNRPDQWVKILPAAGGAGVTA